MLGADVPIAEEQRWDPRDGVRGVHDAVNRRALGNPFAQLSVTDPRAADVDDGDGRGQILQILKASRREERQSGTQAVSRQMERHGSVLFADVPQVGDDVGPDLVECVLESAVRATAAEPPDLPPPDIPPPELQVGQDVPDIVSPPEHNDRERARATRMHGDIGLSFPFLDEAHVLPESGRDKHPFPVLLVLVGSARAERHP